MLSDEVKQKLGRELPRHLIPKSIKLLSKIMSNILKKPDEQKYRAVKISALTKKLGDAQPKCLEVLHEFGFRPTPDGSKIHYPDGSSVHELYVHVKSMLNWAAGKGVVIKCTVQEPPKHQRAEDQENDSMVVDDGAAPDQPQRGSVGERSLSQLNIDSQRVGDKRPRSPASALPANAGPAKRQKPNPGADAPASAGPAPTAEPSAEPAAPEDDERMDDAPPLEPAPVPVTPKQQSDQQILDDMVKERRVRELNSALKEVVHERPLLLQDAVPPAASPISVLSTPGHEQQPASREEMAELRKIQQQISMPPEVVQDWSEEPPEVQQELEKASANPRTKALARRRRQRRESRGLNVMDENASEDEAPAPEQPDAAQEDDETEFANGGHVCMDDLDLLGTDDPAPAKQLSPRKKKQHAQVVIADDSDDEADMAGAEAGGFADGDDGAAEEEHSVPEERSVDGPGQAVADTVFKNDDDDFQVKPVEKAPENPKEKKQKYNKLVRDARTYEGDRKYLKALKKYLKAHKIIQKEALEDKINRMKDKCYEAGEGSSDKALQRVSDDALDQIYTSTGTSLAGAGHEWYENIVTDEYVLLGNDEESTDFMIPGFRESLDDRGRPQLDASGHMVDYGVFSKLYPYQKQGVAWMWTLHKEQIGGILGDDMGLGKTIQTAAFLHGLFVTEQIKTVLMVCPTSVIPHWCRELKNWCYCVRTKILSKQGKKKRIKDIQKIARKGGILVTSYGMVLNNKELLKRYMGKDGTPKELRWDYMILDEGHRIKNPSIGTSKAVREIPVKDCHRLILSGTFIQNKLQELWSLFDWCCEGRLLGQHREFKEQFSDKIDKANDRNATNMQKTLANKLAAVLRRTIAPYVMRRTKLQIKKLQAARGEVAGADKPGAAPRMKLDCTKNELVVWVRLCDTQIKIYEMFLGSDMVKAALNTSNCSLSAMTILKKICDHPFLLSERMVGCEDLQLLADLMKDQSTANRVRCSSKFHALIALVRQMKEEGHRPLIFSQSKKMLNMFTKAFDEEGWKYLRIDGDVPIDLRQRLIDKYNRNKNNKYFAFFLTTQTGGLGINLTGADRVIIFDPAWNPTVDAQAVDRAYRIGQTRDVLVYRFVTCGTIEEKIYRRQVAKMTIMKQVTEAQAQKKYFTKKEVRSVFKLEDPQKSATHQLLSEFHKNVQEHVAYKKEVEQHMDRLLQTIQPQIYGLSKHDLLFTIQEVLEDHPELQEELNALNQQLAAINKRGLRGAAQLKQRENWGDEDEFRERRKKKKAADGMDVDEVDKENMAGGDPNDQPSHPAPQDVVQRFPKECRVKVHTAKGEKFGRLAHWNTHNGRGFIIFEDSDMPKEFYHYTNFEEALPGSMDVPKPAALQPADPSAHNLGPYGFEKPPVLEPGHSDDL